MESQAKVVLLLRNKKNDPDSLCAMRIGRMRSYAKTNHLEIIDEVIAREDCLLHESTAFLNVLNAIENRSEKTKVLTYDDFNGGESHIFDKYKELIARGKVELENYCHPCFIEPDEDDARIWRYLTLPKFLDLLQTNMLFFSRADSLRGDDKTEGASRTNAEVVLADLIRQAEHQGAPFAPDLGSPLSLVEIVELNERRHLYGEKHAIKQMFINCWHLNDSENFAMWKVYSEQFGVCIQSRYSRLVNSFCDESYNPYSASGRIYIGKVRYVDWNSYIIPKDNGFWPFVHKKREFSYENELRCIIWDMENKSFFKKAKIDLNTLIDNIYINPYAPDWFRNVIVDLCKSFNISDGRIIKSSLS